MDDRWFDLRSARRALVRIRPLAERVCLLYRKLERLRPECIRGDQPVDPSYFLLVRHLRASISVLQRQGVRTDDLRRGWVDFPARRAGRDVLLSWKVGERSLAYWREQEDRLAGRRRLDEDGPWEEGPIAMLD